MWALHARRARPLEIGSSMTTDSVRLTHREMPQARDKQAGEPVCRRVIGIAIRGRMRKEI